MLAVAVFCVLAVCVPFSQGKEFKVEGNEIRGKYVMKENFKDNALLAVKKLEPWCDCSKRFLTILNPSLKHRNSKVSK